MAGYVTTTSDVFRQTAKGFNNNVIGLVVAPAFSTGVRRHARSYLPVWRALLQVSTVERGGLLISVAIGLLDAGALASGKGVFTERDWLLLFGHPREKVFTLRLWLFALGHGSNWICQRSLSVALRIRRFVSALILAAVAALIIAPKWLR